VPLKPEFENIDFNRLKNDIKTWGAELGFQQVGISDIDLSEAGEHLNQWLANGYHGNMQYMHKHGTKRYTPELMLEGTLSIISVRLDYMIVGLKPYQQLLNEPEKAAISRYALGRDYHKLIRNKLKKLAAKITAEISEFGYRVFTDSAPVMEKAIAEKAGLGWIGKHSNVLNAKAGSWFFLGEIYTNLPLPVDEKASFHCGSCTSCIDLCPTGAIVAPFRVDARKCISYLTIENKGVIPEQFRKAMGNRIYGCDDCQMVCPWNKFAQTSGEIDFQPRNNFDDVSLLSLFSWSETEFLRKTAGSPIRRIGYISWLRNISVALGNADYSQQIVEALEQKLSINSQILAEHLSWAIAQQQAKFLKFR